MYRVAICEDEKVFADEHERICRGIMEKLNAEYDLSVYSNAADFLKDFFVSRKRYELLLLDIIMTETNGMELAHRIREHDSSAAIIFITSKSGYAIQGYGVNALHYLMKPVDADLLERLIAADYHRRFEKSFLVFKSGAQNLRIAVKDVVYLEISGRRTKIVLIDGTSADYYGKLSDFLSGLKQFVRCHKSYAVNIGNIRELKRTEAVTVNGKIVPVSRAYFKETQNAFLRKIRSV